MNQHILAHLPENQLIIKSNDINTPWLMIHKPTNHSKLFKGLKHSIHYQDSPTKEKPLLSTIKSSVKYAWPPASKSTAYWISSEIWPSISVPKRKRRSTWTCWSEASASTQMEQSSSNQSIPKRKKEQECIQLRPKSTPPKKPTSKVCWRVTKNKTIMAIWAISSKTKSSGKVKK